MTPVVDEMPIADTSTVANETCGANKGSAARQQPSPEQGLMSHPSHGAHLIAPGRARFALWAPDASSVAIELASGSAAVVGGSVQALERCDAGWYRTTLDCAAGTGYRYVVDNYWRVPDPASRQQYHDVHGFSRLVDHGAFGWTQQDWHGRPWHESVICEVHAGLLGGFRGLLEWLPYFQQLGVTALELMPVAEFPGSRNWGYDGALPFAPDTSYGTPDDFKRLIDEAHRHGLMIYLDVVYNHFGPTGNYLSHYASAFFDDDITTPWGPAIDFAQVPVRDFFIENALMWVLDYRVDGLRLDAVHAIVDHSFLIELARRVRAAVAPDRHVHLMLENEHNTVDLLQSGFDGQWNDDMHHVVHTILTNESRGYYGNFAEDRTHKLMKCLTQGFAYQDGNEAAVQTLPPSAFICYLQNHDQIGNRAFGERLLALADANSVWAATVMILLAPMTPMLFMGEELGSYQPFFFFTDHEPGLADAVREGRRKEFRALHAVSSHSAAALPDPDDISTFYASNPYLNARSGSGSPPPQTPYLTRYRELLQLRQQHITAHLPKARSLGARRLGTHAVSARWQLGPHRLHIDVNLGTSQVSFDGLDSSGAGRSGAGRGETLSRHGESRSANEPWPVTKILYAFRVDGQRSELMPGGVRVQLEKTS